MNNEIFSCKRFSQLFIRQFSEIITRKSLLWEMLSLFGAFVTIFFINARTSDYSQEKQWNLFAILFIFSGIYYTKLFLKLRPDSQGLFEMTIPASTLEKLLNVIVFSIVVLPLAYTLTFFATDYFSYFLFSFMDKTNMELLTFDFENWTTPINVMFFAFFILQSVFMLGSLWFKNHQYLKTMALMVALGALFSLFVTANNFLMPTLYDSLTVHPLARMDAEKIAFQSFKPILKASPFVITCVLWVISYFRLQEKEI